MSRRVTSDEERQLFEQTYAEARPIKVAAPKPRLRKPGAGGIQGGINGGTQERLRKGQLEPQARLDLHGMTEAVAYRALSAFLAGAARRGNRLVLVVTGKGNPKNDENPPWMMSPHGVLKQMVPRWLNQPELAALIVSVSPAHVRHGGDGALYVYLGK